ncbi:MAG: phosphohistidine phosphatase SixA [Acidiferrobacterales bacterium]
MRLYLVQHGDALPEDVDPERPLSDRGRIDVERAGGFLAARKTKLDRVIHSGKTRAQQTAERLANSIAPDAPVTMTTGLNPLDDPKPLVQEIGAWRDDVMLVGHLPFMGKLVSWLVVGSPQGSVVTFEPGSVVCLEKGEHGWSVAWMIRPELFESAGR